MSAFRPGNMRGPREMTPLLLLLLLTSLAGTVLCDEVEEDVAEEAPPEEAGSEDAPPEEPPPEEAPPEEAPSEEAPPEEAGTEDLETTTPHDTGTTEPPPVSDDTSSSLEESPSTTVEEYIEGGHGSGDDKIEFNKNYEVGAAPGDMDSVSDPTSLPGAGEIDPTMILIPVGLVVVIIAMIVCGIMVNRRWNQKMRATDQRKDSYLDGCSTDKVPMPMFEEDVPSVLELEMEELDQWMSKDGEAAKDSEHA
ncbi:transmembrane protein 154 isoform X1 [Myripristis murdjan]|uniref:transmembrane protein 154 isoform X1 n=1 Tax=Myripristis murdjan TaxID=586833 RepID=UPI0011764837|nr:transmembrane protein 154 isoform X1 [Myripristis murdjan]